MTNSSLTLHEYQRALLLVQSLASFGEEQEEVLPPFLDFVSDDILQRVLSFLPFADTMRFGQCNKMLYMKTYKSPLRSHTKTDPPRYLALICEDSIQHLLSFLPPADTIRFGECNKICHSHACKCLSLNKVPKIGVLQLECLGRTTTKNVIKRLLRRMGKSDAVHHPFFRQNCQFPRPVKIKIRGIDRLSYVAPAYIPLFGGIRAMQEEIHAAPFPSVNSLDLEVREWDEEPSILLPGDLLRAVQIPFPNLQRVSLIGTTGKVCCEIAAETLTRLTPQGSVKFRYTSFQGTLLSMSGWEFRHLSPPARQLDLEGFVFSERDESYLFDRREREAAKRNGLLSCCPNLHRVNIRNVQIDDLRHGRVRLSDAMIVRFVRYTPSLHWLCSDLSSKSASMLKKERPEITFVR